MKYTYIYGLTDPTTGEVRYVGKADNPGRRYQKHIGALGMSEDNHKARWVKKLLSQGKSPGLVILEKVPHEQWVEAERRWIAHYRAEGARLTNSTDGGEGVDGYRHPPEVRQRLSEVMRGRPVSEETRAKLSLVHTGRKMPEEGVRKSAEAHRRLWEALPAAERQRRIAAMPHTRTPEMDAAQQRKIQGRKTRPSSSQYIGVYWDKANSKWSVQIKIGSRRLYLGRFTDEQEAARAYDAAALEHYGPGARINFPQERAA